MKCKNCEFCDYIEYDGYICTKFNAYIPYEVVEKDIDCMVYDYNASSNEIIINDDGCKDIQTSYYTIKMF